MTNEKDFNIEKIKGSKKAEQRSDQPEVNIEKKQAEQAKEKKIEKILDPSQAFKEGVGQEGIVQTTNVGQAMKKREKEIEKVLESDLEEVYKNMAPAKQAEFSRAGEVTAKKINAILSEAKIKIKKIIDLIKSWLKLIPGINSFFLEQEAKIKADEIIKMKNDSFRG